MHLTADTVYAEPRVDDYPNSIGFRDSEADYCVILSRFSDMEPDSGKINVMVRDQIRTETANVVLELSRTQCRIRLDEEAATELLGVREYTIDYQIDRATYGRVIELLTVILEGLSGLKVNDV